MAVVNLNQLYDLVLPHTPGATTQIMLHYAQLAAREFCTRTRAWNFVTDPLDTVAGEAFIDSESVVSSAEPCAILQVWYDESLLWPMTDGQYQFLQFCEDATPQRWIGVPNALGIQLWPRPVEDKVGAVRMRIAMRPKRDSMQIDADLFNQWHTVLAEGIKAYMFLSPKKPYSDVNMARISRAEFLRGIADARWKKTLGYTPATMAVTPPPFGV